MIWILLLKDKFYKKIKNYIYNIWYKIYIFKYPYIHNNRNESLLKTLYNKNKFNSYYEY